MFRRILIIVVIGGFSPVCRYFSLIIQNRFERPALNIGGYVYSGKIQQSGSKIHIHGNGIRNTSALDSLRVADDQWHTLTFLIHEAFIEPTMFA